MAKWVNGKVVDSDGHDIPSKAELKRLVKAGRPVWFTPNSPLGPQWKGSVHDLPFEVMLSVAGPDPHTNRKWMARLSRSRDHIAVI